MMKSEKYQYIWSKSPESSLFFLSSATNYSKCPKILYTEVSDKISYANSADWNQNERVVWSRSTLFAIPLSILWNNCIKKQNSDQKGMELNVRNFRTFTVLIFDRTLALDWYVSS